MTNTTTSETATSYSITNPAIAGRYTDFVIVGKGTSGTIWSAFDKHLNRKVAIKQISVAKSEKSRIIAEVNLLAHLNHPGILRLLDVIQDRDYVYLTQPYCDRGTLEKWSSSSQVSYDQRIQAFGKILQAVGYLHRQNWAHADIKPANILVDDRQQPYLSDFGIATKLSSQAPNTPQPEQQWIGTAGYMAPELLRQESPPSIASDIYALGVSLYELLSNTRAFDDDTHLAVQQSLENRIPKLTTRGIPSRGDWNSIIQKATASKPVDRYRTIVEFQDDIAKLEQRKPLTAQRGSRRAQLVKWVQREPVMATLSLVSIAIAIIGFWSSLIAWRQASTHLNAVQMEQQRLMQRSEEVQTAQTKLAQLIEEARTATVEAERQETLANESIKKIRELDDQSRIAKQKGSELESAMEMAMDQSIESWKSILDAAVKAKLQDDNPVNSAAIVEAKQKLIAAFREHIEGKYSEIALPEDEEVRFQFLSRIYDELKRSQQVAVGKIDLEESDLASFHFQSEILPGGYFVTDWLDTKRPLSIEGPDGRWLDIQRDEFHSRLVDLGTMSIPPASGPQQLQLQDASGSPVRNTFAEIHAVSRSNSKYAPPPKETTFWASSDSEGIVNVPFDCRFVQAIRVAGFDSLTKVDVDTQVNKLTKVTISTKGKTVIANQIQGKALFKEKTNVEFKALTDVHHLSVLPDGNLFVSFGPFKTEKMKMAFGTLKKGFSQLPVAPYDLANENNNVPTQVEFRPNPTAIAANGDIYFLHATQTSSLLYRFPMGRKDQQPLTSILTIPHCNKILIAPWDPLHLYTIYPDHIAQYRLPLNIDSAPGNFSIRSEDFVILQLLSPKHVLVRQNRSKYVFDMDRDELFETDITGEITASEFPQQYYQYFSGLFESSISELSLDFVNDPKPLKQPVTKPPASTPSDLNPSMVPPLNEKSKWRWNSLGKAKGGMEHSATGTKFTVTELSDKKWEAQCVSPGFKVQEGQEYEVSLTAKSPTNMPIDVLASINTADYHEIGLIKYIRLEPEYRTYVFRFRAVRVGTNDGRICLHFGHALGTASIKSITMVHLD